MKEMDHILRLQQRITLVLVSCGHLCQLSQSFRLRLWQKITGNICSVSITIQYASQAGMCLCRRAVEEVCGETFGDGSTLWQGPLINELSQPCRLGQARGHTSVSLSSDIFSQTGCQLLTQGFSRCSKVSVRGGHCRQITILTLRLWHLSQWNNFPQVLSILKQFLLEASALGNGLSVLFQMLIWLAGVRSICDKGSCLWWHVWFEINWCC